MRAGAGPQEGESAGGGGDWAGQARRRWAQQQYLRRDRQRTFGWQHYNRQDGLDSRLEALMDEVRDEAALPHTSCSASITKEKPPPKDT